MNKATPAKNPGFEQKNRSRRRNRNCKIWPGFDRGRGRGRGPGRSIHIKGSLYPHYTYITRSCPYTHIIRIRNEGIPIPTLYAII